MGIEPSATLPLKTNLFAELTLLHYIMTFFAAFLLLLMLPVLLSHSCFPLACSLHGVFPIFITFICSSIAFISLLLVIGHRGVWSVSVT